jgi:hypothetical protein
MANTGRETRSSRLRYRADDTKRMLFGTVFFGLFVAISCVAAVLGGIYASTLIHRNVLHSDDPDAVTNKLGPWVRDRDTPVPTEPDALRSAREAAEREKPMGAFQTESRAPATASADIGDDYHPLLAAEKAAAVIAAARTEVAL